MGLLGLLWLTTIGRAHIAPKREALVDFLKVKRSSSRGRGEPRPLDQACGARSQAWRDAAPERARRTRATSPNPMTTSHAALELVGRGALQSHELPSDGDPLPPPSPPSPGSRPPLLSPPTLLPPVLSPPLLSPPAFEPPAFAPPAFAPP